MKKLALILMTLAVLASCKKTEEPSPTPEPKPEPELVPIQIATTMTRATDYAFETSDKVGLFVVNEPKNLQASGNHVDNCKFTFDGAKWNAGNEIYWFDATTKADFYCYYPYTSVENVNEYAFEAQKDQSTEAMNGKLGGYEASDFLWGKAGNTAPTDRIVRLSFAHMMAGVRLSLVKGTGFSDEEWAAASKEALILNTKRNATVNLATGVVTATGEAGGTGIIPYRHGEDFRAVVVPQEIAAGTPVISVTVAGVSYKFSRSEAMTFTASKQHNFTITVNKKAPGDFEFKLSDESITAWENDAVSHDATTTENNVPGCKMPSFAPGTFCLLHRLTAVVCKEMSFAME